MPKVINLNRYRKQRARREKEQRAETNRRLHGRTKAERARDEAEKKRLDKKLDGAFLVRERVSDGDFEGDAADVFERLEELTHNVRTLREFHRREAESSAEKVEARDETRGDFPEDANDFQGESEDEGRH